MELQVKTSTKTVLDRYFMDIPEIAGFAERCLSSERWGGNPVLMVLDAAFTSIGMLYFQTVVPAVRRFERELVNKGKMATLEELSKIKEENFLFFWKNRRSWQVAKETAGVLACYAGEQSLSDIKALRYWAAQANYLTWKKDPVGRISGVGINTFQYLRMMGGADTVMPDKIVRRIINNILVEAGEEPENDELLFIKRVETISNETGYRPMELCWMTWLVQAEIDKTRYAGYKEALANI